MKATISLIHADNFQEEIEQGEKPVLLLCTHCDGELSGQLNLLQAFVQEQNGDLKGGVLAEEFVGAFKESYGVRGTPTYLLLICGQERGRLLGLADMKALKDWLGDLNIFS